MKSTPPSAPAINSAGSSAARWCCSSPSPKNRRTLTRKPASPKPSVTSSPRSLSEKDALKQVARERGIGKSEAYREFQREPQAKRSGELSPTAHLAPPSLAEAVHIN